MRRFLYIKPFGYFIGFKITKDNFEGQIGAFWWFACPYFISLNHKRTRYQIGFLHRKPWYKFDWRITKIVYRD